MSAQHDSDPLPYSQIDRSVKPKAALLAGALGVTTQHALGSLVEFWDLCGDPRQLEKLLTDGATAVVLERAEVVRRMQLASGKTADADQLASLGLLEPVGADRFRVRGMSRYLAPIRSRLISREKGRAGGLASAAARKAKNGTAQPAKSLVSGSRPASILVQPDFEQNQTPLDLGSGRVQPESEAAPNLPEASVSGQRSLEEDVRAQAPRPPRKRSAHEDFFVWGQVEASKREPARETESPPSPTVLNAQLKPAADRIGRKGLELAWTKYLDDLGARAKGWPWNFFVSQWERHHNAVAATPMATKEVPCTVL